MFENFARVLSIVSETEIEVYTMDTRETLILKLEDYEVEDLRDSIENDEMIIIAYDRENKTIDRSVKEF